MERLWAPWRMEYSCFLCVDPSRDEEALVLGRDERAFVIMNRFPYTNGHVMVVPVRHVGVLESLSEHELVSMMKFVQRMVVVLKKSFNVDGVNIGINVGRAAGAGLEEHVHIHIVPRWFGDTNFMALSGETRVISEHLLTSYKRLKSAFLETVF
jgi:ATP adenylyltransferase